MLTRPTARGTHRFTAAAGTRDDEGDGGALSMTMMLLQKGADPTTHIHDKRGQGKTAHELGEARGRPPCPTCSVRRRRRSRTSKPTTRPSTSPRRSPPRRKCSPRRQAPGESGGESGERVELDPDKAHAAAARAAQDADDEASAALAVNAEARAALLKRCTRSTPGSTTPSARLPTCGATWKRWRSRSARRPCRSANAASSKCARTAPCRAQLPSAPRCARTRMLAPRACSTC